MTIEPIKDYAIVGDCHGCALISKKGSIDWLVFESFDKNPLLWRLLDSTQGSFMKVGLSKEFKWSRSYLSGTNILITEAKNSKSTLRITDFMPVGRCPSSKPHDYTRLIAPGMLIRQIEVIGAPIKISLDFKLLPWPEEGKLPFIHIDGRLYDLELGGLKKTIEHGIPMNVVISNKYSPNIKNPEKLLQVTRSFWMEWIEYSRYRGPSRGKIERSALALKALTHSPSGAIVAAATTSLPEIIGGTRNWDYRFCWVRDAVFTLYSLSYLGYSGEADGFSKYLERAIKSGTNLVEVFYTLDGNAPFQERLLKDVKGHADSGPVRIGNDAFKQLQLDVYGEYIDWVYLHQQLGGKVSRDLLQRVREIADFVFNNWKLKDSGMWEVRSAPEDFTYSKIMCWVALDRAQQLLGENKDYSLEKMKIESFILEECVYDGRLKRSAQSHELDASLLLAKIVGYPIDKKIYSKTVTAIMEELSDGTFVKRYKSEDGLPGEEGEFTICSFWAVNAMLFLGWRDKAEKLYEVILNKCLNDVGLMSEEINSHTGEFLGNFPQGLSHLALIETASYFELYDKSGLKALIGSHGDRVKNLHTTLHGPKAVWDYLIKTHNFKKIVPSKDSILKY